MLPNSRTIIFGMLFLKRLSDVFEAEQVIEHYLSIGKSRKDAERLAQDEGEYQTFFVPERARWRG